MIFIYKLFFTLVFCCCCCLFVCLFLIFFTFYRKRDLRGLVPSGARSTLRFSPTIQSVAMRTRRSGPIKSCTVNEFQQSGSKLSFIVDGGLQVVGRVVVVETIQATAKC